MKFLPDVKLNEVALNQREIYISWLVFKSQTKILKNLIFRNTTSSHANFTTFCRILNIDLRNNPWKIQIDILQIAYSIEQSVDWHKMLVYKIQNSL